MLWAITSYFNPIGYASRRRNYRVFRQNLRVPLAVVELSCGNDFELNRDDAEIVVQIAGGDILWQKERLLNVALRHLPAECDSVAWIDCDVILESPDWAERAERALEKFRMVQLFSERRNLVRDAKAGAGIEPEYEAKAAVASMIVAGTAEDNDLRTGLRSTAGLAWAMKRGLAEAHGFYDACILGTGDRAMLCAAMGNLNPAVNVLSMQPRQIDHYRDWATRFHRDVQGSVGFIEGRALHLWHGSLRDRKYTARYVGLAKFEFDPFTDISLAPSGCWQWADGKREMHEYVKRYFEQRREDG